MLFASRYRCGRSRCRYSAFGCRYQFAFSSKSKALYSSCWLVIIDDEICDFIKNCVPGRVARAGRPGLSFNLVAPDELPYLIDLFLFLGRGIKVADSKLDGADGKAGIFTFKFRKLLELLLSNLYSRFCNNWSIA